MPDKPRAPHTRICCTCHRRQPVRGFRGGICGECCLADLLQFPADRLAAALHYATGLLRCKDWDTIAHILNTPQD